ncbi:hypothetical protein K3495_g3332 [Podosphaera aphanis]|nr:hypothetical protein K3495_g3332 [Podosphaera aphanis]
MGVSNNEEGMAALQALEWRQSSKSSSAYSTTFWRTDSYCSTQNENYYHNTSFDQSTPQIAINLYRLSNSLSSPQKPRNSNSLTELSLPLYLEAIYFESENDCAELDNLATTISFPNETAIDAQEQHESFFYVEFPSLSASPPRLHLSLDHDCPLTSSASPYPTDDKTIESSEFSVDYFDRVFEQFQFTNTDFSYKDLSAAAPSLTDSESCSVLHPDQTEKEEMHQSKPRGSSRRRSTIRIREGLKNTSKNLRQPSQKAMLSKALQKANTAVLLDNAQNFEGAKQAYFEACDLLYQVMLRSSGEEDYRKLEAIHTTYTGRISELEKIAPRLVDDSKALPARPDGDVNETFEQELIGKGEPVSQASSTSSTNHKYVAEHTQNPSLLPPRRESLLQSGSDSSRNSRDSLSAGLYSKSSSDIMFTLGSPMNSLYMPPPLSPRRPISPKNHDTSNTSNRENRSPDPPLPKANETVSNGQTKISSSDSISWQKTNREPGGQNMSPYSRNSSGKAFRKSLCRSSSGTETQFDAALDAAVEAAYDDSFQSLNSPDATSNHADVEEIFANVRQKVDFAKDRLHQSEQKAAAHSAQELERSRHIQQLIQNGFEDEHEFYEVEDEERLLEEITRDIGITDSGSTFISKSNKIQELQATGFSQRTWNSSKGLNPTTTEKAKSNTPQVPPIPKVTQFQTRPFAALTLSPPPELPPLPSPLINKSPASSSKSNSPTTNNQRLSRQKSNQFKVDTSKKYPPDHSDPPILPLHVKGSKNVFPVQFKTSEINFPRPNMVSNSDRSHRLNLPAHISSKNSQNNLSSLHTNSGDGSESQLSGTASSARAPSKNDLRTKISSSSLRRIKARHFSASNTEDGSDTSPNTPANSNFNGRADANKVHPAMPYLPSSIAITIEEKARSFQSENMSMFDNEINLPESPMSPPAIDVGAPIPLEPCPTEFLLRPFWLMRALYQTITHPKGGYISNKLFIPCDVWRVKGVKIKNLEEKIANCEILTAALNRLARVDTFDADAVLDEMQALETTIEQVQAALTKKLGNEVGVQSFGGSGAFKDVSAEGETENSSILSKSGTTSSKSSFSWRRLRSKNSGAGLSNSYSSKTPVDCSKENLRISTLPMATATATAPVAKTRFVRRDLNQISFSGPNAGYMGALARLFDSAQTVEQIARQVEDPGLRHADKTQVGLELCTRHAAEFFGFYICRFALADVTMLLDKFIKRGGEWVLV